MVGAQAFWGRRMNPHGGFVGVLQAKGACRQGALDLAAVALRATSSGRLLCGAWGATAHATDWLHVGEISVACHGEIFNAGDLCAQLGLAVDTPLLQLLVVGWQRWQMQLLQRLDGVFALAVRDGDELTLYRDPSGLSALYRYHDHSGNVVFATDLDALFRLPGTVRRLARHSLHEYLRFLEIATPNTFYANVTAVEAGQVLHWPQRESKALPRVRPPAATTPPAHFSAAVDQLDSHLQRSVLTRLSDASRPAAFLSGGVDSALLCAMASRHRRDTVAVTVGFESPAYDESPTAQRIAAHLGMTHEVMRFSRADYLAAFERFSTHAEQPMADPTSLATLLVAERCRDKYDIVIDGTGADEAVGMMPPRHVRLAVRSAALLPAGARRGLTTLMGGISGLRAFTPIVDFEHPADTMIRWGGFTRPEIEGLCGDPVSFAHTSFYRTFDQHRRARPFDLYSALVEAMTADRLNQAMRISGMRMRFPFYEARSDQFLRALPVDFRYSPGQPKRILRALLARYVPPTIWNGPKHGFDFPLHEFLAAENFALVRRYLNVSTLSESAGLQPGQLERFSKQFMAGDQRLTFRIWALVVLSAWLEHHGNSL